MLTRTIQVCVFIAAVSLTSLNPTMLQAPIITEHDSFLVVRDDLLLGGTKRRAIHVFFDEHDTYAYASPVYGYAQIALAYAARDHGKQAKVFCAQRKRLHPRTQAAVDAGAKIFQVPYGYMNVVTARAREYCYYYNWKLLPFGLDDERFIQALADVALKLPVKPKEVWTVVGSGCLSRALQLAWPDTKFYGVRVGSEPNAGNAEVLVAPEKYEQDARVVPPFPSCSNYDAKLWQFVKQYAKPGALIWNVGA